jgi:hypothetical protein
MNRTLSLMALLFVVAGCAGLNDPYYGNQGYGGYGAPGYGGGYEYDRRRREREDLRDERRDIERERERLERERDRLNHDRRPPPPPAYRPPPPPPERCPSGFSPSEQKCSPDERRRGCKDIRLPGGLGCVSR